MNHETKTTILTHLESVLEYFTDSDISGLRGFLLSLTPFIISLTSMNQILSTISAISGIIWLWVCIYYKIKAAKTTKKDE
ncbi:hypothetical protein VB776_16385 [Arcicella sp. DC2W]|uniref:Uncharacterized protein n=1 Tax=Arcicella gelida TaxID=2984195 RepID=A0ABU5S7R5_9BACT|nr:hypothetical protein [Arcicella sp. DC2W]MEA5404512.1 hypothetical protein [Arcicella sp. DC2W]